MTNPGSGSAQPPAAHQQPDKTILIVMGVAGSGKTVVAHQLAARLDWSFAEADDFHPAGNVVKMSSGIPLTDDDRLPWLKDIRSWIDAHPHSAVVTCSALRRSYRDVLSRADARVRFIHLDGTVEQLSRRLSSRIGHFMPASMLDSQLETLERLEPDEDGVVIDIDATPAEIVDAALATLDLPGDPSGPATNPANLAREISGVSARRSSDGG